MLWTSYLSQWCKTNIWLWLQTAFTICQSPWQIRCSEQYINKNKFYGYTKDSNCSFLPFSPWGRVVKRPIDKLKINAIQCYATLKFPFVVDKHCHIADQKSISNLNISLQPHRGAQLKFYHSLFCLVHRLFFCFIKTAFFSKFLISISEMGWKMIITSVSFAKAWTTSELHFSGKICSVKFVSLPKQYLYVFKFVNITWNQAASFCLLLL